ncbi:F0F1 ATP synthase subunit gamma [Desulfovibrio mangrovi]|uniref:F0F1 ATP synthase subunit gamma n=1 Tax=Desulfovibrio mangrovi TaxID=2976983 RepID=UPI0022459DEC|nr:F0F1 ATP synthase subunit gamma [Desulfovibrio mangrovi]UZP68801.1 F0F1 ATP synthase subunit gamma [Desulfovibrio mangrovi]
MQGLQALSKRIHTATELLGVVKTMKSLAAVNIRHFEQAARSLEEYAAVVEMGWHVFLRGQGASQRFPVSGTAVVLAVGSDQGMCGQFNEVVLERTLEEGRLLRDSGLSVVLWGVGERIRLGLEDAGFPPAQTFPLPGTLSGVNAVVGGIVQHMAEHVPESSAHRLHVVFNAPAGGQGYAVCHERVLPLDREWGQRVLDRKWPGRCLPQRGASAPVLFAGLFEQHLFVSLYGAVARSLAAENAARLSSMQAAEKNIMEMLDELHAAFRDARQSAITGELLDITAGFEALMGS